MGRRCQGFGGHRKLNRSALAFPAVIRGTTARNEHGSFFLRIVYCPQLVAERFNDTAPHIPLQKGVTGWLIPLADNSHGGPPVCDTKTCRRKWSTR